MSTSKAQQVTSTTVKEVTAGLAELDFNVSDEEISQAKQYWQESSQSNYLELNFVQHPVLPKPNTKNILVTSALPYVNNVPHLGNIIGCCLSADIFTKYCRMSGINTLFLCGTDEYGTTTETKALEEGLTCQQICAKYYKEHKRAYDWFNIEFDYFGRTSTKKQTEISQNIFHKLNENKFIFDDKVEQLYCEACVKFLADRFVEGTCPFCEYVDARGDQCDKCGKLINAIELKLPRCKTCSKSPVIKSSQHLFLDLPKLTGDLETWLNGAIEKGNWTNTASVISKAWLKEGLKPRCITRDLKWGTPVPLQGFEDKVFYVWFDAPIGYLSIAANYTDEWERWFKSTEPNTQVEYYQFMAKDNVPFHSVIFPSCLLGTRDNYTLVGHLSGIEYLNYEDGKFSKSRGVGIFGNQAKLTELDADIFRFYLAYIRPEGMDTTFSWEDFMTKNNSELLNNLGNFVNRALAFCEKNWDGVVPAVHLTHDDAKILAKVNQELAEYKDNLERVRLRDGIRNILNISRVGNQYMQARKPWTLVKGTDEEKLAGGTVIALCVNIAYVVSLVLYPYMPRVALALRKQLGLNEYQVVSEKEEYDGESIRPDVFSSPRFHAKLRQFVYEGHRIGKPEPLFKRIGEADVKLWKEKFGGGGVEAKPEEPKKSKNQLNKEKKAAAKAAAAASVDSVKLETTTTTNTTAGNQ